MTHRVALFEKYCLPSILHQKNQDFTWLIAFDEDTPHEVIRKYDYIENVEVCYEQPHFHMRKKRPEAEWLITSRFDNDDRLDVQFTDMIQAAFREQVEVIDVEYQALEVNTGKLYTSDRPLPNSHFLSLIEPWGREPLTALGRPHTEMPEYFPARRLPKVLALQVVHDRNVCNKIWGDEV